MEKREIKFRVFDKNENDIVRWELLNDGIIDLYHLFFAKDENLIIQQFTGLLDNNGKEIYEGDVISYREHRKYLQSSFIGEVVWLDSHCAFGYVFNDKNRIKKYPFNSIDEIQNDFLNHTEVIGNIYQNSYLIKNGK
jgi:uncharacterized phage protein (TIGR01671 family)